MIMAVVLHPGSVPGLLDALHGDLFVPAGDQDDD